MTSIKFVNTQDLWGSPPMQYTKPNTSPIISTSSLLPNFAASSTNPRSFDLEHQMRMFMVEKRGHENQQQHNPTPAPTAALIAPPPRKYMRSSKSKPWFIAPPPGGRGLAPAIATSATYYAASGRVVTRTELRPVHRGSPTLSHKSSSSTSSSPVEAPSAHNRSRPKDNLPDTAWGVRPVPSATPTVLRGPNDILWPAPSPSDSPQLSPNPRPLTHIESPLLPPLPSSTLLGRSSSLTRRNNSDLRIVPPPLTPTGVAGKTGPPPPPVSPPMPKPRSSPGRARKTPVSRTSDVLDTVYSIYNKLPTSRDRSGSDSGDRDFVSRLATKIAPRRNTPSPSPPPTNSPQPAPQPQIAQLPPPPPPKPRPGDVSPPIIPLVELPGTIPSTPPQSRPPARRRSPRPRSPRGPGSPQSPPPSRESQEVYSKLPLPAVPALTPTKPLFSNEPSTLPQLSPLSNPPTSPAPGKTSMAGNFDVDLGYAVELVEWFENFCYPCQSASTVATFSPRTPNSSNSPPYPPSPKKNPTTKTTSADPTILILSDEESPVTGRQQFTNLQPSLEVERNLSPNFLSPFKAHNSGMCFPKRKPVPMSMYSTASSVGDAFRFDYEDLSPISDGGSTSGEDDGDGQDREGERLRVQIEDILNSAVYLKDVDEVEGAGEVEPEGGWRRTRYIAGRNSALEGDVIFCLKASEL